MKELEEAIKQTTRAENQQDHDKLVKQLGNEHRKAKKEEAIKARKALHDNKCGKCGDELATVPFRGVEIEICPSCGAVLLDAGELEQLAGSDNAGVISSFFETFFGNK